MNFSEYYPVSWFIYRKRCFLYRDRILWRRWPWRTDKSSAWGQIKTTGQPYRKMDPTVIWSIKIHAWKVFDWNFFLNFVPKKIWLRFFRTRPILHRDLKSRNVFLKNNQIKLGDMGVSRVLAESFANTFLGTPFYMSPEMIKDSKYDCKEKFYMNWIITRIKIL